MHLEKKYTSASLVLLQLEILKFVSSIIIVGSLFNLLLVKYKYFVEKQSSMSRMKEYSSGMYVYEPWMMSMGPLKTRDRCRTATTK